MRSKDEPADLINVALEELVRARLELPGYSTLDEMTAAIRMEVNTALFAGIAARMSGPDAMELDATLIVDPIRRRSRFDRAKEIAGAPTVGNLRDRVRHLAELEAIGPTGFWLEGILPAKIAHFAGEARALRRGRTIRRSQGYSLHVTALPETHQAYWPPQPRSTPTARPPPIVRRTASMQIDLPRLPWSAISVDFPPGLPEPRGARGG